MLISFRRPLRETIVQHRENYVTTCGILKHNNNNNVD